MTRNEEIKLILDRMQDDSLKRRGLVPDIPDMDTQRFAHAKLDGFEQALNQMYRELDVR